MILRSDIYEEDHELVVVVEAPGVRPEKLEVRVREDAICVEGAAADGGRVAPARRYHRRERAPGAFRRELALPAPVCPGVAEASVERGLLTLRLPLARASRGAWRPVEVT